MHTPGRRFPRYACAGIQRLARELLRWRPVQPGLIEDLDKGHYFG